MRWPRWLRRRSSESVRLGDYGDAYVSVTKRPGDSPQVEIELPEAYARLVEFQVKTDDLGPLHDETLLAAHRYATTIGRIPAKRPDAIALLEWLVDMQLDRPHVVRKLRQQIADLEQLRYRDLLNGL
ncbi:hypothetical protein [Nonomuraea sp. NPDC049400]|uniref:hypothetical protein n=1 Tax=Nonomuraea sp. NPDC049400 TaxID=3364352 RepID=UPI00379C0B36